ncbi:uncharacterized protein LOC123397239 [Hordeum vulgare subsp. vulgare]|uniref:uncharacterized protein LOC123397239 n=1 Tax=Hordeum vulgare subsp. vulgare TaxID=112509 RepID=UPI001D1A43DF|nr:uncharacterized protein LOC123397239 [Hordeum vulgare subsp. vulgare]
MPREPLECVKLLVKAGADLNFIDFDGGSYMMLAVKFDLPGIMKFLLDADANPNIPDECGSTPIEVAASKGSRDMVEMLFPLTSPISTLPGWSIYGIISHVKLFGLKPRDKQMCTKRKTEVKRKASEAFKRGGYFMASEMYSCKYERACEAFADGLKLDPTNGDLANALRDVASFLEHLCAASLVLVLTYLPRALLRVPRVRSRDRPVPREERLQDVRGGVLRLLPRYAGRVVLLLAQAARHPA